ncbi:hypothetical protein O181_106879 [Austropuccinia psidii MF-1]|uniref:Uncharacterized protein n=1 Tax=Austropuccinia psidii MF-1 TaxID=1389203 RepID=A0A9Q3JS58_9BASI|nr:hypothetical protein [Austropuccinia psidii MF-1]
MPCEQTPWQPTSGPKPSQHNDPPIPGPSPSSEPPEDIPTHEPEPEVAPMQSREDPFGKSPLLFLYSYQLFPPLLQSTLAHPATPCSVIIIHDMPIGSPLLILLPLM